MLGTSPRMRGKSQSVGGGDSGLRNIPAYAGKIKCRSCRRTRRREHPRVCGENASSTCMISMMVGTSPRTRGKLPTWNRRGRLRRNIPAYAGKTFEQVYEQDETGENLNAPSSALGAVGTSPRTRGKPAIQFFVVGYKRNIPAYAGKTISSS